MNNYLTAPRASKNMPKGIPYIIGNELAERFSFYGMKCILIIIFSPLSEGNVYMVSGGQGGQGVRWSRWLRWSRG